MDREEYGSDYQEHLLAQYKQMVDLTEMMATRRDRRHQLYLSLNTALFALITGVKTTWLTTIEETIGWLLPGLGAVLCMLWLINIESMRSINSARFTVINELEKELPAKPFTDEWDLLEKSASYFGLSKLEQCVPFLMGLAFLVLAFLPLFS